jgi:hypothetical protein
MGQSNFLRLPLPLSHPSPTLLRLAPESKSLAWNDKSQDAGKATKKRPAQVRLKPGSPARAIGCGGAPRRVFMQSTRPCTRAHETNGVEKMKKLFVAAGLALALTKQKEREEGIDGQYQTD